MRTCDVGATTKEARRPRCGGGRTIYAVSRLRRLAVSGSSATGIKIVCDSEHCNDDQRKKKIDPNNNHASANVWGARRTPDGRKRYPSRSSGARRRAGECLRRGRRARSWCEEPRPRQMRGPPTVAAFRPPPIQSVLARGSASILRDRGFPVPGFRTRGLGWLTGAATRSLIASGKMPAHRGRKGGGSPVPREGPQLT